MKTLKIQLPLNCSCLTTCKELQEENLVLYTEKNTSGGCFVNLEFIKNSSSNNENYDYHKVKNLSYRIAERNCSNCEFKETEQIKKKSVLKEFYFESPESKTDTIVQNQKAEFSNWRVLDLFLKREKSLGELIDSNLRVCVDVFCCTQKINLESLNDILNKVADFLFKENIILSKSVWAVKILEEETKVVSYNISKEDLNYGFKISSKEASLKQIIESLKEIN